jgi:hypothetical protein
MASMVGWADRHQHEVLRIMPHRLTMRQGQSWPCLFGVPMARLSCETVEKGLSSADFLPAKKFPPKANCVIKVI